MKPLQLRTFIHFLSIRSASILMTSLCIGFLLSCSGNVSGPEFHVSGGVFKTGQCDFTAEKTFETEFPVENQFRVNLEAINGEVVVTGQVDANSVVVSAHRSVCSDTLEDAEMHIDDLKILVTGSADEILIQTVHPQNYGGRKYLVEYDIIVPSTFEVVTTQVNGNIAILDVENTADVLNVNGDVQLSGIFGGVMTDVANGSIEANVVLPVDEAIDLSTINGSIELTIPTSTSAEFFAAVVNGEISVSNLDITGVVKTKKSLTGVIGDGEGTIELSTSNGNIEVVGFD